MSAYVVVEPPLEAPLYGATFGQAVNRYFKKYTTFSGRASRSEYWWVQLFLFLVALVPAIFMSLGRTVQVSEGEDGVFTEVIFSNGWYTFGSILALLMFLAFVIPSLAITWRRLHDANLAGPFFFLEFIPGVGHIIVLILMLLPSNPQGARFDRGI